MRKTFLLLAAMCCMGAMMAQNNVITYTAKKQLREESINSNGLGFRPDAFNVAVTSHTFAGGQGTITFAGDVTYLANKAFYGCGDLYSITLPNSVTSIGVEAFAWCKQLKSVGMPANLTIIRNRAFEGCNMLTSLTIPAGVTSIGERAIPCPGITSLEVPDGVQTIGLSAFKGVANIVYHGTAIDENGGNWGAYSKNGYVEEPLVYSDASKTTLIRCSSMATGVITLPNSVVTLMDEAFNGCCYLTSVELPNSVVNIGDGALLGPANIVYHGSIELCSMCEYMRGWNGVVDGYFVYTNQNKDTLAGCSFAIGDVVEIPNGVTYIGYQLLNNSYITAISLPKSLMEINAEAFSSSSLSDIYCYASYYPTLISLEGKAFDNVHSQCRLYVPEGSRNLYEGVRGDNTSSPVWGDFQNIYEMAVQPTGDPYENVAVSTSQANAKFIWPIHVAAETYTIEVKQNDVVVRSVKVNRVGQVVGSSYAPLRQMANVNTTGCVNAFEVLNLEPATEYTYSLVARDDDDAKVASYNGTFTTGGEALKFTITASAIDGTVTGGGEYEKGAEVTLTATPNQGYEFKQWSDGTTINPYVFTATLDVNIMALFKEIADGIEEVHNAQCTMHNVRKLMRDGQLLIIRDGKTYNAQGARL